MNRFGYIRAAAVSPSVTIGDATANAAVILELAGELANNGVSIGLFPELCLSGYSAEDLFFSETLLHDTEQALITLCAGNPLPLLVVGAPWRLSTLR